MQLVSEKPVKTIKSVPSSDAEPTLTDSKNVKRPRGQGAQTVYEMLRQEILTLQLKPGSPLDEASISQRFQLSRSPVREALARLKNDNLVERQANRSTIVSPFKIERLPAYLDALQLLQRMTARLAAYWRTELDLEELRQAHQHFLDILKQGDVMQSITANRDFHAAIGRASHNHYLYEPYIRLLDEGQRLQGLYFTALKDLDRSSSVEDHDRMLQAIEQQDANQAEKWAQQHTAQFDEHFFRYVMQKWSTGLSINRYSA